MLINKINRSHEMRLFSEIGVIDQKQPGFWITILNK